jgi:tetratricopeptide (TPR) repeat protein
MFPLPVEPKRSTPVVYQAHPLDYMVDLYYRVFGDKLFYLYQDVYLKLKKNSFTSGDRKLLYFARSYHLAYRYNLALRCYEDILSEYPDSEYRQDALFFCGMLYFETGKYEKAIAMLKELLDKFPLKWKNAGSCYLGLSYDAIGNIPGAIKAYRNCEIYQLTPDMLSKLIEFKR